MKGKLVKTEKGWIVRYKETTPLSITTETLPLHPKCGIPQDAMCDVLDNGFAEVEFEIVHFWENGEVGVNGLTYAKLIQNHQSFIDNRKDKLETLAKLLAKTWFYCDWKWESPNERVMQMLMQDLGLYPFKDEDEMIQQTKIDDGLDKELYKEANRRIPTYGKLSEDLVENKLDLSKMEQKLDDALANETSESLTEWMNSKREDDVEKLVISEWKEYEERTGFPPYMYHIGFTEGYNKCKETLYTEEQVREAIWQTLAIQSRGFDISAEEIIKSLKQPK